MHSNRSKSISNSSTKFKANNKHSLNRHYTAILSQSWPKPSKSKLDKHPSFTETLYLWNLNHQLLGWSIKSEGEIGIESDQLPVVVVKSESDLRAELWETFWRCCVNLKARCLLAMLALRFGENKSVTVAVLLFYSPLCHQNIHFSVTKILNSAFYGTRRDKGSHLVAPRTRNCAHRTFSLLFFFYNGKQLK